MTDSRAGTQSSHLTLLRPLPPLGLGSRSSMLELPAPAPALPRGGAESAAPARKWPLRPRLVWSWSCSCTGELPRASAGARASPATAAKLLNRLHLTLGVGKEDEWFPPPQRGRGQRLRWKPGTEVGAKLSRARSAHRITP